MRKTPNLVFLALAISMGTAAFAESYVSPYQKSSANNVARFEQYKAELISHIDPRKMNAQAEKACIQAAQDRQSVVACRTQYMITPKPTGKVHVPIRVQTPNPAPDQTEEIWSPPIPQK